MIVFPDELKISGVLGEGILALFGSHGHQGLEKENYMTGSYIRITMNGVEIFPKKKMPDKYRCLLQ